MAKSDDDTVLGNRDLALIIATLSTVSEFNPDFHKVAEILGISHGRTAQQKFKKLIESTKKYGLVNGKVTDLEDPDQPSTPTAKKGRPKSTTTPRTTPGRKRKAVKKDISDNSDSDVDVEAEAIPAKKAKPTPRKSTKAVKQEDPGAETGDGSESEEVDVTKVDAATAEEDNSDQDVASDKEGGD